MYFSAWALKVICHNRPYVITIYLFFHLCVFFPLLCETHLSLTVEFFRKFKVFSQNCFEKVYNTLKLYQFIFYFQLMGFCVACYVIYVFTEEDDSCKYKLFSFIIIYIVHRKVFCLVSSQVVWQLCTVFLRCLLNISVSVLFILSWVCNTSYFHYWTTFSVYSVEYVFVICKCHILFCFIVVIYQHHFQTLFSSYSAFLSHFVSGMFFLCGMADVLIYDWSEKICRPQLLLLLPLCRACLLQRNLKVEMCCMIRR